MKLKLGKEVREVSIKFYQTYDEAIADKFSFNHTVEIEGIHYPTTVEVEGIPYHSRVIERSIPVKPYSLDELVYIRGAK